MSITEADLVRLTTCTQMFMNHVHWVQASFNLIPDKQHYGTCINYVDLQEYRKEFCSELVATIPEWVYSQTKAAKVLDELVAEGRSDRNAQAALQLATFDKFRNRDNREVFTQGQFGELLLFNFIQSFFRAVPLLRKMPITTTSTVERFGADAIHYNFSEDKHKIYIGEAKSYTSSYKFKAAINDAIDSILENYANHRNELRLYVYDSFIDEDLIQIAKQYKNGKLPNVEVHLVSIIAYEETKALEKKSESQIKTDIIKIIEDRGASLERALFDRIDVGLHPRFNYIILPVWELDELLKEFQRLIGK